MMSMDYSEQLEFAKRTAHTAGQLLLRRVSETSSYHTAADHYSGVVTGSDIDSDKFIRHAIDESYPDYGLVSEESSIKKGNDFVWIVDPKDGTNNDHRNFDYFSVSIGLRHNGVGVVGVVYAPALKKMYYAVKNGGAYMEYNNISRKLLITDEQRAYSRRMFTPSFGCVTDLTDRDKWSQVIEKLLSSGTVKTMRRRMLESTALELCGIAEGFFDAHFNNYPKLWDWAGGEVVCREAGGNVTYIEIDGKNDILIADNGAFSDSLVKIVRKVFGV